MPPFSASVPIINPGTSWKNTIGRLKVSHRSANRASLVCVPGLTRLYSSPAGGLCGTKVLPLCWAAMVMISGLGVFGLWTGILATGFAAETRRDNFLKTWETVSKVPFFASLGPSAIADVTQMLRTIDLPSRTMIIRKGQQGDCMYFIASGEVEVDLPGKKVQLGEGAFFGEMALLGNNTRNANITTTRLSKLLVLDLVDFRLLMARHPDLAETIDAEAKRRALENK